ncbi:hypothetical protein [Pseudanabaena sp. 'Roaring Creek']|uniref:hypothetical protein n=1 Tax=Pseudanabaena sp. 'Roaring Creek' TaxID=1681830 RepID=UPI0006D7DE48|nr:hypothetical protein [Pseudanabaena sp. 'Roaring Creek']
MSNPTSTQLLNVADTALASALTSLGLPATSDARLAIREILNALQTQYATNFGATAPLVTYTSSKSAQNIDLETQRETYTFTVDMAISLTAPKDEPVVATP